MKDAKALLELLMKRIPPGKGQRHNITINNGHLEVCLMLGNVYLPITLEPGDFEMPIEELAEQIWSFSQ